jgi:hypothetical protein
VSTTSLNHWLIVAGWGSLAAALFHLACIVGGPDWYRFAGAGEGMARAVERGFLRPHLMTAVIAAILLGWAAYAFSAAGQFVRLPLTRTALTLICAVLWLRAAAFFVRSSWRPDLSLSFMVWSSLIVLVLALCFTAGTVRAWPTLSQSRIG